MNIGVEQKGKKFLTSEEILKYLIGNDDSLDTLITCQHTEIELVTTDFNVHEAIGSIKEEDNFKLNKLAKLFEAVKIVSYQNINHRPKPILKFDRMEELRKKAITVRLEDKDGRKKD